MAERLRKVANQPAMFAIVLFCQQPNIVAQGKQPFEQLMRLRQTPLQRVAIHQPEAARQKGALTWRQAILARAGVVAPHQAVSQQAVFDGGDRAGHARIGGRQEANSREQQQAGIEAVGAERLHK